MAAGGRTFPLDNYLGQSSWEAKRAWCTKFTVDEECAWLSVEEQEAATKIYFFDCGLRIHVPLGRGEVEWHDMESLGRDLDGDADGVGGRMSHTACRQCAVEKNRSHDVQLQEEETDLVDNDPRQIAHNF